MVIRREIEVKRKGLPRPIDVTYGTNLLDIEFTIIDFNVPAGTEVRVFAMGGSQTVKSIPCNIDGNKVWFTPEAGLFEEGKNVLQLALEYEGKNLYTFYNPVNCHYTMQFEGAKELENDPTFVAMVMRMQQDIAELKEKGTGATEEQIEQIEKNKQEINNLSKQKADKTDLTNQFNFKGSTTFAELPTEGNVVNDTYYCTDMNCCYSWNGGAWYQSSIDESVYLAELNELRGQIDDVKKATTYTKTILEDIVPQNTFSDGYWWNNGAGQNAGYIYSDLLQVEMGDIVTCVNSADNQLQAFRFVEAYSEDGNINASASISTDTYTYTVPENVASIRVSPYSVNKETKVIHIQRSKQKIVSKIDELNDDLSKFTIKKEPTNWLNVDGLSVGYMEKGQVYTGGNYDSFRYTEPIPVTEGDIIKFFIPPNGYIFPMRSVNAFDSEMNVIIDKCGSGTEYNVPNGVSYVVISDSNLYATDPTTRFICKDGQYHEYSEYFKPYDALIVEEDLSKITETIFETIELETNKTVGFVSANGTVYNDYTDYTYTNKIPVKEGEVISGVFVGTSMFRVITAYSGNTAIESKSVQNTKEPYVVPNGIDGVIITVYKNSLLSLTKEYSVKVVKGLDSLNERVNKLEQFADISINTDGGELKRVQAYSGKILLDKYKTSARKITVSASMKLVGANDVVIEFIDRYDTVRNKLVITSTQLEWFNDNFGGSTSNTLVENHGLSLTNDLHVSINTNNYECKIILISNGEKYECNFAINKMGCTYPALSMTDVNTDISFSVVVNDVRKPIWCFGDSYFSPYPDRWLYYLLKSDYADNVLVDGYSGEDSYNSMASLESLIQLGKPKYLLWCLGMNDYGDSNGVISNSYNVNINKLIDICTRYGITLVIGVVPTVPNINHEAKAELVRNSGYQYVDFYKAVGTNANGQWYDGMLSNDEVHPTEKGAKSLWGQVLSDFPQIAITK